jgi:undecaprenyl-diphosphatase
MFRTSPMLIALFLILFGLLLAFADPTGAKRWRMDKVNLKFAILIGLAQCLALIPGVSRSGITITAALLLGFHREAAARFSFLISLPIVAGAAILKVGHLLKTAIPAGEGLPLAIGISTSAFFGFLSVVILLKLVQRDSLYPFVWYRLFAGCGALALIFFLG